MKIKELCKELSKQDKIELESISKKLSEYVNQSVRDRNLKKRIAKICLKLIRETSKNKSSMMETSYLITGIFFKNDYKDELDEAFNLAGELELPEEHLSGNIFELWDKMKKIFEEYLK